MDYFSSNGSLLHQQVVTKLISDVLL